MTKNKKAFGKVKVGVKETHEDEEKPVAHPGRIGKNWVPLREEYPTILIGKDPDGWYGLAVNGAYCGWTHKADRKLILDGIYAVLDETTKELSVNLEKAKETNADLRDENERITDLATQVTDALEKAQKELEALKKRVKKGGRK